MQPILRSVCRSQLSTAVMILLQRPTVSQLQFIATQSNCSSSSHPVSELAGSQRRRSLGDSAILHRRILPQLRVQPRAPPCRHSAAAMSAEGQQQSTAADYSKFEALAHELADAAAGVTCNYFR